MVIMIDDDNDALEIYQMLIETSEFADHFRTFNNGLNAMEFLENSVASPMTFPRYILLDLNMPGLGGIDFITEYETRYKHQRKPTEIIILTSSVREKDNKKALSYDSVTRFVSKPLPKDDLLLLIKESINI